MSPDIFIGREPELQTLCAAFHAALQQAAVSGQPQVICREDGIGKSRLAIQAARVICLQDQCEMVFHLTVASSAPGDTAQVLDTQLASLARPSHLNLYRAGQAPAELDVRRQDVIAALRQSRGR